MRTIICGTVASLLLLTPAYSQPRPQGPVPVGVVTAAKQPIARSAEFVGRIEAIERVDLRARVTGYLDAVLFKEGDRVKEGDPLFRIDQAPFQASVQQAQGALLRAQGVYTNASLQARGPRSWSRPARRQSPSGISALRISRARRATL